MSAVNDFVVKFANVNGSGSASANALFAKSILRMGVPVAARNIFPSNIQGLPTWFEVRVTEAGNLGRRGGVSTGVVAGLATITPASGFVGPLGAMALGAAGSLVCYHAVDVVKAWLKIDDSLDVFAVHGIGGILGSLLVAVLASPMLGGAGYAAGVDMAGQALTQVIGVAATVAWSGIATLVLIFIVRRTIGLRARDETIEDGLDMADHGERAWNP